MTVVVATKKNLTFGIFYLETFKWEVYISAVFTVSMLFSFCLHWLNRIVAQQPFFFLFVIVKCSACPHCGLQC